MALTTNSAISGETYLGRPFQLIVADRIVPRTLYPQKEDNKFGAYFVGKSGEYVVDFIQEVERMKSIELFPERLRKSSDENAADAGSLLDCVRAWLNLISPGVNLSADTVSGTDFVSLSYSYSGLDGLGESDQFRPTNVGFGLTYSLPIIVSGLSLPRGGLLLVENPEAHLHPRGQLELGRFLSVVANDGVQVVVETHSDHLLNGIRLSVKESLIKASDAKLHYLSRDIERGETSSVSPELDENGKLSFWPDGFFDEWEKALHDLI